MSTPDQNADSSNKGYETSDAKIGLPVFGAIGVTVISLIAVIAMTVMFGILQEREIRNAPEISPMAVQRTAPPTPRLQTDPSEQMRLTRASAESLLTNYGWIDRENGVVRIPIHRAMKLVLESGMPVRKKGQPGR